ncbi:MAG: Chemotaxis regulator CheY [Pseudomonadota bacterium]|jgi:two-component system chemotaxis response regulator CheY
MARNVLVVDDSASMRALVSGTLKGLGFQTHEAENGQQALERIRTMPTVDFVITDLNMPVMDGITLVQNLRKLAALKYVPVLLLTTETRSDYKDKAKAAGATGWLTKPFDPKQLTAVVQRILP